MTIQEALKSGKPFRRPIWGVGFFCEVDANGRIVNWINQEYAELDKVDILATDWETKDEPK